jgi:hypothetical protein
VNAGRRAHHAVGAAHAGAVEPAAAGKVRTYVSRVRPLSELGTIFDDPKRGRCLDRALLTDLSH